MSYAIFFLFFFLKKGVLSDSLQAQLLKPLIFIFLVEKWTCFIIRRGKIKAKQMQNKNNHCNETFMDGKKIGLGFISRNFFSFFFSCPRGPSRNIIFCPECKSRYRMQRVNMASRFQRVPFYLSVGPLSYYIPIKGLSFTCRRAVSLFLSGHSFRTVQKKYACDQEGFFFIICFLRSCQGHFLSLPPPPPPPLTLFAYASWNPGVQTRYRASCVYVRS